VIGGSGPARLESALAVVRHDAPKPDAGPRWQWACDHCGDVNCERHLLARG
jgi:hypothetical protein